ncbi:hypothetical protein C8R41DRAFT_871341 [Lentinula lateritia]|uniref:Uncharacterized protein n=1 Tax=Lentinula lateritia TaxID=40482 RepID=A0ABQ8V081_9AGAR|nr:hypothetical protein C8R41DRAFT_871341 [Lentinula lateritia]
MILPLRRTSVGSSICFLERNGQTDSSIRVDPDSSACTCNLNNPEFPFCNEPEDTTTLSQTSSSHDPTVTRTITQTATASSPIVESTSADSAHSLNTLSSISINEYLITKSTYTQPNFHGQFKWHKLNGNPVTEIEYANHWRIKHTGAIVGGVIGSVALITAILGVFYIRRRSKNRNGALGSSLESQPPLARKPVPVILTPDPFTLKYLESRRDVDIFEQGSSTTTVNPLLSDGRIDELMRRMLTLETLLAAQSPGPQRSLPIVTPLPPNYTNVNGRV